MFSLLATKAGSVAQRRPSRPAGRLDQLDEHAVAAADGGTRPGPRRPCAGAVSISSMPSISRRSSVSARFATSKQTWWKPSPFFARKRATPVVSSVGSTSLIFDSPTARNAIRTRSVRDVHDGVELEAERVAPEPERRVDRADDDRHVVDAAEAADGSGDRAE